MATVLSTPEDIQWLKDVHLSHCKRLPETIAAAMLEGPADAPDCVTLYEYDHVNSLTMTLTRWPNGNFYCDSSRY
jgi:hypothetical protein